MLDKKINETIDVLTKKIKENNLTSIKLSNKSNTIEISNNLTSQFPNQNTQNNTTIGNETCQMFHRDAGPLIRAERQHAEREAPGGRRYGAPPDWGGGFIARETGEEVDRLKF